MDKMLSIENCAGLNEHRREAVSGTKGDKETERPQCETREDEASVELLLHMSGCAAAER